MFALQIKPVSFNWTLRKLTWQNIYNTNQILAFADTYAYVVSPSFYRFSVKSRCKRSQSPFFACYWCITWRFKAFVPQKLSALDTEITTEQRKRVNASRFREQVSTQGNAARASAAIRMLLANTDTVALMAWNARNVRRDGKEPTAKTSHHAFLGFLVRDMALARNQGVTANVNLAGWETCATALSVKYHASLAHVQIIQTSASATKTSLALHATGINVLFSRSWSLVMSSILWTFLTTLDLALFPVHVVRDQLVIIGRFHCWGRKLADASVSDFCIVTWKSNVSWWVKKKKKKKKKPDPDGQEALHTKQDEHYFFRDEVTFYVFKSKAYPSSFYSSSGILFVRWGHQFNS